MFRSTLHSFNSQAILRELLPNREVRPYSLRISHDSMWLTCSAGEGVYILAVSNPVSEPVRLPMDALPTILTWIKNRNILACSLANGLTVS